MTTINPPDVKAHHKSCTASFLALGHHPQLVHTVCACITKMNLIIKSSRDAELSTRLLFKDLAVKEKKAPESMGISHSLASHQDGHTWLQGISLRHSAILYRSMDSLASL